MELGQRTLETVEIMIDKPSNSAEGSRIAVGLLTSRYFVLTHAVQQARDLNVAAGDPS